MDGWMDVPPGLSGVLDDHRKENQNIISFGKKRNHIDTY